MPSRETPISHADALALNIGERIVVVDRPRPAWPAPARTTSGVVTSQANGDTLFIRPDTDATDEWAVSYRDILEVL